ncbi:sulfur carrier protein ThiS [Geobacter sp. SVR]|uniref:sulfur carrier protein ThiS n=1 Tax=Geobacter sp. SVR TaxID=2495594 RepID=UPI00143EF71C|nr:sulfur carrier protein ThiS [Geobacter sp. SVR]BCS55706.1 sulfur carrier protein ThiS [Geobacter sp. SVR]GCF83710.1 sulfur carrier protein ThiS [Geobacter sp. SVR]
MQVLVNGEPMEVEDSVNIAALLAHLHIKPERVAVEVNLDIVPKATYGARIVSAGDRIEIVQFVGGGC